MSANKLGENTIAPKIATKPIIIKMLDFSILMCCVLMNNKRINMACFKSYLYLRSKETYFVTEVFCIKQDRWQRID